MHTMAVMWSKRPSPGLLALCMAVQALALPAPAAAKAGACAAAALESLQSHYQGVRDFSARFEQKQESAMYPGPEISTGRVELARPGRMRWQYETPHASLFVADGETAWLVSTADDGVREVTVLPLAESFVSVTALAFLFGTARIKEQFEVDATRCVKHSAQLRLTPRAGAAYEYIELQVELPEGAFDEFVIGDLFGNRMRMRFAEARINQGIPAERFRYEPGPGERVLVPDASP